jgi:hypothetical protein
MADPQIIQQQTEYQTGFAPQLAPYGERLLGASEGQIFDYKRDPVTNQIIMERDEQGNLTGMPAIQGFKPYMQYQGERFAQFSPLQQQAFAGAQAMEAAPQLADASALAGTAGLRALQAGTYGPMYYTPQSFTQQGTAGGFMSPYMQNVVEFQQREAQRQADIASTARGQKYARAGAFGGARQAIENAEAQRNLSTQLGGIQATGLQAAYQQAQQQFNQEQAQRQAAVQLAEQSRQYGAGLGLQGLQTALQGAQQLGTLGQTQFGQNIALNQLQSQYGGQQQQQMQNILGAQYQDFLNAQNYPFKQLGFMSDILRGAPITQTGATVYGQPPSTLSTVAGLGSVGKGLGLFAKGGAVEDVEYREKPAGLADLAIYNMGT